ncbi:MAG TPA: hypothetical protein VF111_15755 [Thermoanaerobaculia bacterium]
MATRKSLPYWLGGGTEVCGLCTHRHALETEFRCAACDRASCVHCVAIDRETGEVLCHECVAGEENG